LTRSSGDSQRSERHWRSVAHFDAEASGWRDIYDGGGLWAVIVRERMEAALAWLESLSPSPASRILEVGVGAGLLTGELARRGYLVEAIDSSSEMVTLASRHADEMGLSGSVNAQVADVHALPFAAGSFGHVVALGVIPWVEDPGLAIAEMARVLRPGGHLLVSANNRARLNRLVDPRGNPLLGRPRHAYHRIRRRGRPPAGPTYRYQWRSSIDELIAAAGLERHRARTIGFGPLSFLGRRLFDDATDIRLHDRIQALADRGIPGLRGTGSHYLVDARKPD
jgi:2-polyprenyl-3-methyl-5-hydroxy-6-metoxy-1,4-benzoquinol methylase